MYQKRIAPSILSCDFSRLYYECNEVLRAGADWLHIDVMDGHFVPNITIGPCVVEALRKAIPGAYLDCHLMVSEPEKWLQAFKKAGADMLTFHYEVFYNSEACIRLVKYIYQQGIKAGVSIKPKTAPEELSDELLQAVDMVLVMTVEPGFGGQSYMPECAEKCKNLKQRRPELLVEVDGGISDKTIDHAAAQGIDVFVAGSYIYNAPDRKAQIDNLRK